MDLDASTPTARSYRERSLGKVRRFAHGFAFRKFQFDAGGKSFSYRLSKTFLLLGRLIQRGPQYLPGFLFHRTAVMRRADAQFQLGFVVDFSNGQRSHTSMLALLSMSSPTRWPWPS